jgi:hypothetical protein
VVCGVRGSERCEEEREEGERGTHDWGRERVLASTSLGGSWWRVGFRIAAWEDVPRPRSRR